MTRFRISRRVRRGTVALAIVGASVAAVPATALAYQGYGGTLTPNAAVCVQQYANTQVRGEGTASRKGALFTLRYSGQNPGVGRVIASSPVQTTSAWAAEARPSFRKFPGSGFYQVCAVNLNSTNTLVNIDVQVDGELP